MTPDERWLATTWPLVQAHIPRTPARVVDIGCGPLGGFVPMLLASGYDAVGIDPRAPGESHYRRARFEDAELPEPVDAVVASTSLHHVADPVAVIERILSVLRSGGVVVVVEWAWERFDGETAEWCFARLGEDAQAGWLQRRRDEWRASGREWSRYLHDWAERERLHRGDTIVRLLDERLERRFLAHGPYFFADLPGTSETDEESAIDAGQIRATRIDYAAVVEG